MINYITGFFYDISPIDPRPFWGQWDLQASFQMRAIHFCFRFWFRLPFTFENFFERMKDIHTFTRKIFRDHIFGEEESISNTASVDTLRKIFETDTLKG